MSIARYLFRGSLLIKYASASRHSGTCIAVRRAGRSSPALCASLKWNATFSSVIARRKSSRYVRVEPDLDRTALILRRQSLFAFAGFRKRRMNLHFAVLHAHPDGARTFVGKLRHALDRLAELFPIQNRPSADDPWASTRSKSGKFPVSLRLSSRRSPNWKNRWLSSPGELACKASRLASLRQLQNLAHCFAGQQGAICARDAGQVPSHAPPSPGDDHRSPPSSSHCS